MKRKWSTNDANEEDVDVVGELGELDPVAPDQEKETETDGDEKDARTVLCLHPVYPLGFASDNLPSLPMSVLWLSDSDDLHGSEIQALFSLS